VITKKPAAASMRGGQMAKRRTSNKVIIKTNQVYERFVQYHHQNGISPTLRELCDLMKIESLSQMRGYINRLVDEGRLKKKPGLARGICLPSDLPPSQNEHQAIQKTETPRQIIPRRQTSKTNIRIPVLGKISAGTPLHIPESGFHRMDPDSSSVAVPVELLSTSDQKKELYALQVEGDSMIDALIAEGDYVILRHTPTADNGAMVAAWWNSKEETTLKYYHKEKDRIRLLPANPNYQPIYIDDPSDLEIQGIVIAVMRKIH
jgi:repressor LexA